MVSTKCANNTVRSWIESARPSFGCLFETRVQENLCHGIIENTFPGWSHVTNYDFHRLGRIWLVWSNVVEVHPVHISPQSISVSIKTVSGDQFLCSCVYASNFQKEQLLLWEELRRVIDQHDSGNVPWIIMGDFNVTLSSSETSRSLDYRADQTGMRDFQKFVTDCEVSDLEYTGPELTW